MSKTATIHVRMEENIKEEALEVLNTLGISMAEAITLYLKQIILKNGIPFSLTAEKKSGRVLDRISEYKREDLQKVLDVVPDSVDELWVFGSAVTKYCRPDSDLDVCIIGDSISKEDRRTLAHAPRYGMDLINATHEEFSRESKEEGSVFYEIKRKGLLVYKKGIGLTDGKV